MTYLLPDGDEYKPVEGAQLPQNSPISYLPVTANINPSDNRYTAVLLGVPFAVDTESVFAAAAKWERFGEELWGQNKNLFLQNISFSGYDALLEAELKPVRNQLYKAVNEVLELEAILRHAGQLYTEIENKVGDLFSLGWSSLSLFPWERSLGNTTKTGVNWAAQHFGNDVAFYDWASTKMYIFNETAKAQGQSQKVTYQEHELELMGGSYLLFVAADSRKRNYKYIATLRQKEAEFKELMREKTDGDKLKFSSAQLFHMYITLEKLAGRYLPYLQVSEVGPAGFPKHTVSLEREKIHFGNQNIREMLPSSASNARPLTTISAPTSIYQLLSRVQEVRNHPTAPLAIPDANGKRRGGEIEIIRYTRPSAFGARPIHSYSVVLYGTQQWLPGSSNPQDMTTNFGALAGLRTDQEAAVMVALEKSGRNRATGSSS